MTENAKQHVYCTVNQIAADTSFCFSIASLRYYIINAHKNGLSKAIRKISRKILLRKYLFIPWIEEQSFKGGRV